jgi:hypothetical protein
LRQTANSNLGLQQFSFLLQPRFLSAHYDHNWLIAPVSLFLQRGLSGSGQLNFIAPGVGQSQAQQPQYQHSSACRMMGGAPFCGFGIKTSIGHVSTHLLHPLHMLGSKITGMLGV